MNVSTVLFSIIYYAILREKLGHKRILLSVVQKRRLAMKGKKLGRKLLLQYGTLFSPDTILKWHRWFIARKYDSSYKPRRGAIPKKANLIRDLVLRMAAENPDWGYGRITGEIQNLGYDVSRQTIRRVMREHGLMDDPHTPKRPTWNTFIKSHWESIAACDFFTVEAWTKTGLKRFLVLFFVDLASRRVKLAGIHPQPHEEWMIQQARNITDWESGFLKGKRFLIHDRDPLFTRRFQKTLRASGVRCLKMPKQSPNLNGYAERFVWSIRHECLNKMVLLGERHVHYVIQEYINHYNSERPHQGLGNRRINHAEQPPPAREGPILCRQRLGGLLNSYHRQQVA